MITQTSNTDVIIKLMKQLLRDYFRNVSICKWCVCVRSAVVCLHFLGP